MPRPASTKKSKSNANSENVEYIVSGSSPLYSACAVLTFLLTAAAIAMQYIELTGTFGYSSTILF